MPFFFSGPVGIASEEKGKAFLFTAVPEHSRGSSGKATRIQ